MLLYPVVLTCPVRPIDDFQYPPQSAPAQVQAPQGVSSFVDGSGPIFSMYMDMATEEDKKMAENWQKDADGILIFVSLYLLVWCFNQLNRRRPVYSQLLLHP